MESQKAVDARAARCAWARIPACSVEASLAARLYGAAEISERHRHRYEVNNAYREAAGGGGLHGSPALSPDEQLVEIIELPDHPWFLGCQFHPEFARAV